MGGKLTPEATRTDPADLIASGSEAAMASSFERVVTSFDPLVPLLAAGAFDSGAAQEVAATAVRARTGRRRRKRTGAPWAESKVVAWATGVVHGASP
jgi:hypothetical protein